MAGGTISSRYRNATFYPPPPPALTVRKHIESRFFIAGGLVHDRPTRTLQLDRASLRGPPALWPVIIRSVPLPSPMIIRGPHRLKLPRVACRCLATGIQAHLRDGADCCRRAAHLSLHRHFDRSLCRRNGYPPPPGITAPIAAAIAPTMFLFQARYLRLPTGEQTWTCSYAGKDSHER